jgi:DNA repair exonuclease SbcCD ATPase subunit
MKCVNFKKLTIQNFLSFGNDPVTMEFKKGLNIVTGINRDDNDRRNGLGKSSMMESLYYAIFGSTIRGDLKKELITNSFTNGLCKIEVELDVQVGNKTDSYKVIRTANPSKLYLYHNGTDITLDSIKNTEEFLHKLINATPSIFENCVIMTLNNTVPFMAKNKVDKRKFIEGILNLDVFSKMLNISRDEFNSKKKDYEIELNRMQGIERSLNSFVSQRKNILDNRVQKLQKYLDRKDSNIQEKTKIETDILSLKVDSMDDIKLNLNKLNDALVKINNGLDDGMEKYWKVDGAIENLKQRIKQVESKPKFCPLCKRENAEHSHVEMDKEKVECESKIVTLNEKKNEIQEFINKMRSKRDTVKNGIDACNLKVSTVKLGQQKKINLEARLTQLNEWLSTLDEDIQSMQSQETELDETILSEEKLLNNTKDVVNDNRNKMNMFETMKFIFSEDGVKTYIVNKILEVLNERIQYYLNKMNANCLCYFDCHFEEEIINDNNKKCSYFNFSGAERKSIDFACLFAFMDMRMLQGDVCYNVAIYDELFDSCLDDKGINLITDIINERVKKYNECVYVISHRRESLEAATGDVIFLEKKDNITRKIDYNPFN